MPFETQNFLDNPKRLVLLDGMALTYRAHFALIRSPRRTSAGLCTSAVFGVVNTVLDLLTRHKPTHIAVALDTPEPTERHELFPEYKAQREAMPEDIAAQLPYIDKLFKALNIYSIRMPGYEADDVIGTLAWEASDQGFQTWMVTPDKDYHQLVRDDVVIFKPGRKGAEYELLGVDEVCKQWDIKSVDQVIDILGLMGDSSDNIPGVPGIGPKTAQTLIAKFGSVESLLENTNQLKGKQREQLEANKELALLSKRLVTIKTDVPHQLAFDALSWNGYNQEALKALFAELEFDTLGKRIFGATFSAAASRAATVREKLEVAIQTRLFADEPAGHTSFATPPASDASPPDASTTRTSTIPTSTIPTSTIPTSTTANQTVAQESAAYTSVDRLRTIHDVPHAYQTITTSQERQRLLDELLRHPTVCFDTETTGLDARRASLLGIAFAFEPHAAFYVVCPDDMACSDNREPSQTILEEFRPFFENPNITKVGHNLKYDLTLLKWHGMDVKGPLFDTMLGHSLTQPELKHSMDYLSEVYLRYQPISIKSLIGHDGPTQKNMRDVPLEQVGPYACEDADITLQLAAVVAKEMEREEVTRVCETAEFPLVPVLVDMEYEGIRLDSEALRRYSTILGNEIDELQAKIFQLAGHSFNIDSPKQLGVVLYDELKIEANPKKTATGQYSTREAELLRLANRHEMVALILDYRNARKLKTVYVDQLPDAVDPRTGRLHTHYEQTWIATGRLQSNNPNLQTIPVRKERGREIRAAFVPRDDDHLLLAADYSQIELRIMAELSGDEGMLQAFADGIDIHTATASKVYHVPVDEVTREMRDKSKTVNFGIIYGISAFGLQQRLNIPRQEAAELIKNYFDTYPGVQAYIDRTVEFARQHEYVTTLAGRRRYIRDINSHTKSLAAAAERLAMNSPIQGTAADMLKLAMVKVHRALKEGNFQTKMLLTVHDEIVFDMLKSEQEAVMPVIELAMKTAIPMKVPIEVELGVGENWLEAH